MNKALVSGLFLAVFIAPLQAIEIHGYIQGCHDPSTPIYENGRYWVFSTRNNLSLRYSYDLVTWHEGLRPFTYQSGVPNYMRDFLLGCDTGSAWNLWAPEIIKYGDLYYLYYSRNMCRDHDCTEHSVCGLAIGSSIANRNWVDQGAVLWSGLCNVYRRNIDPALMFDTNGTLWMAVGSFGHPSGNGWTHGGIWLYQMDKDTGMVQSGTSPTQLARAWIEAPYLYHKDGYYYLFFNQETCCSGTDSRYFIRYARATAITGPYYDKEGVDVMTQNNGSIFLGRDYDANYSSGNVPRPEFGSVGREIGPGHIGIFTAQDGLEMFSFHFYDADANGNATLGIRTLIWGDDGWPRAGWDMKDGNYAIVTCMNTDPDAPPGGLFVEAADGFSDTPQIWGWNGGANQLWNFTRLARNQYRITCLATGKSLAALSSDGGYQVRLVTYTGANAQRWNVVQTNNRAFRMINEATSLALEVKDGENTAGAAMTVGQWDTAQPGRQMFWLSPTGIYAMRNSFGQHAAAVADSNPATRLRINDWTGSNYQRWRFIPTHDGYTKIVNVGSGLPVELRNGTSSDYEWIRQNTDLNDNSQKWAVEPLTDGSSRILNKTTGKAIETAGSANNALTRQRRWLHTLAQQWSLELLTNAPTGRTWLGNGSTENWSEAANWNLPAVSDELLVFSGTAGLNNTNDLAQDRRISSIWFLAAAGGFTLNGNRIGLSGDIANLANAAQTLNVPMDLLDGKIVMFNTLDGDIRVNGLISGQGHLVKNGTKTLTLANENTYSGSTTVLAGTLKIAAGNALPADTALTVAAEGTVDLNGFDLTVETLDAQGTIVNTGCSEAMLSVLNPFYTIVLPGSGTDGLNALAGRWLDTACSGPDWCMGADRDRNGTVDIRDFQDLAAHWLGCN